MKNKSLFYNPKTKEIFRVLDSKESEVLVINCTKKQMPYWTEFDSISSYYLITEDELQDLTDTHFQELIVPSKEYKYAQERFSLISNIIPIIGDKNKRTQMIRIISETNNCSKQTIKNILCQYLTYQDIAALAPQKNNEKELTTDEKNMRWALNKFFYTKNKNSLSTAYVMMLKEKYTDEYNNLLPHPTIHQFRYFYRKTRKMETYYISRDGVKDYQRNHRPLLGEGIRTVANSIGTAMLDSTICDIYLVNDRQELIGRPLMTACIDVYSGLCCGYSLTWEGGMYSLRSLMLNVVTDKKEHCRKFGINIEESDWNCDQLPATLITDKGSEYASENFEQLTDLGVSIINLPAYRPELKGAVEKFFDVIQSLYKPQLLGKGVIESDFQERGSHDYRRDACLTLEQFEKIILRCIIYYNTQRIVKNSPLIEQNIPPHSCSIWNYYLTYNDDFLISVSPQNLLLCLLPRTKGVFKRNGLNVNSLRYKHKTYTEMYLVGGEVTVAYNPEDVSYIWLIEENGTYVKFELINSQFYGKDLSFVEKYMESSKKLIAENTDDNLRAKVSLSKDIDFVISESVRSNVSTKNIRKNRQKEQELTHRDFVKEYEL